MKSATLFLDALAPISIRTGREPSGSETLRYIPGSTLRGALASAHRFLRPDKTDEFSAFFMSGAVRFGNAYPLRQVGDAATKSLPLPLTARSCKRYPGFDTATGNEHGVVDALIPSLAFTLTGQQQIDILTPIDACGGKTSDEQLCGEPLQTIRGFFQRLPGDEGYTLVEPQVQLTTHVAIHRSHRVAQHGVLYQREALIRDTVFATSWHGDDQVLDDVIAFAREASDEGVLRVGTARTRGFGQVGLQLVQYEDEATQPDLRARLETFFEKLHDYVGCFGVSPLDRLLVPVTFQSDTIFRDDFGRYLGQPPPSYWTKLGFPADTHVVWSAAEVRRVMGWDAILGLPKDDQWAVAMGSVLVLSVPGIIDDVLPVLERIEQNGLGERKEEGFGRVAVADAFHVEVGAV